jgi:hypothetical protein
MECKCTAIMRLFELIKYLLKLLHNYLCLSWNAPAAKHTRWYPASFCFQTGIGNRDAVYYMTSFDAWAQMVSTLSYYDWISAKSHPWISIAAVNTLTCDCPRRYWIRRRYCSGTNSVFLICKVSPTMYFQLFVPCEHASAHRCSHGFADALQVTHHHISSYIIIYWQGLWRRAVVRKHHDNSQRGAGWGGIYEIR